MSKPRAGITGNPLPRCPWVLSDPGEAGGRGKGDNKGSGSLESKDRDELHLGPSHLGSLTVIFFFLAWGGEVGSEKVSPIV